MNFVSYISLIWLTASVAMFSHNNAYGQNKVLRQQLQSVREAAVLMSLDGQAAGVSTYIRENSIMTLNSGKSYYIFSPHEKILADFIAGNLGVIIDDARNGISYDWGYLNKKEERDEYFYYATDTLHLILSAIVRQQQTWIEKNIAESGRYTDIERKFLSLQLDYAANFGSFCSFDSDSFIFRAKEFAAETTGSQLSTYINELIWTPKTPVLGASSSVFGSSLIFAGKGSGYIAPGLLYGMSVDFSYKRARIYAGFGNSLFSSVKQDVTVRGTKWDKDEKLRIGHVAAGLSCNILPQGNILLSPYAGAHVTSVYNISGRVMANDSTPNSVTSGIAPAFGLSADLRRPLMGCDQYRLKDLERRFLFVRLQALYYPKPFDKTSGINWGDVFYLGLSVGLYSDYLQK
jgi:hypothetical protein